MGVVFSGSGLLWEWPYTDLSGIMLHPKHTSSLMFSIVVPLSHLYDGDGNPKARHSKNKDVVVDRNHTFSGTPSGSKFGPYDVSSGSKNGDPKAEN